MKNLLIILIATVCTTPVLSQVADDKYMDLFDLCIVMEEHEKCLKKSMKYTEAEKSKKDAQPWLYATMANYGISKNNKLKAKYPVALNDAIKAATKFRKKDRSGKHWIRNQEFFDKFKGEILEKYTAETKAGSPKMAVKVLKKMIKVDQRDFGLLLACGVTHVVANKLEGITMIETALDSILSVYDGVKYEAETKEKEAFLAMCFIEYSDMLAKKEDHLELAKRIIQTGKNIMAENDEVQRQFKRMNR